MKSEHLEIRGRADGVEVVADDYEVFDFIDDFLTARGLQSEFSREEEHEGQRLYIMHFGPGVTVEHLTEILGEVSVHEIERIWRLNN